MLLLKASTQGNVGRRDTLYLPAHERSTIDVEEAKNLQQGQGSSSEEAAVDLHSHIFILTCPLITVHPSRSRQRSQAFIIRRFRWPLLWYSLLSCLAVQLSQYHSNTHMHEARTSLTVSKACCYVRFYLVSGRCLR